MSTTASASIRWFLSHIRSNSSAISWHPITKGRKMPTPGCHRHQRYWYSHHLATSSSYPAPSALPWAKLLQSHQGEDNVTLLVDHLLAYTQHLMEAEDDSSAPSQQHDGPRHHVLAFSGGVDSSLVAALLLQSANYYSTFTANHSVQAVLGVSPAVPKEQIDLARRVANHLQMSLVEVPTTEGNDEIYRANAGQACWACKTHLYTCLQAVAQHATQSQQQPQGPPALSNPLATSTTTPLVRLYNGTNADDLLDATRVGLLAAAQFQVLSPLQYITKTQVRLAARHLGLPNHHMAASPCLRSRLALGVEAIPEHLQRIEQAERHVRRALSLPETASFRVRLLSGQRARLEVEEEYLEQARQLLLSSRRFNETNDTESNLRHVFLQQLGFADVTVALFKSGSVSRPMLSTVTSSKAIASQSETDDDSDNESDGGMVAAIH